MLSDLDPCGSCPIVSLPDDILAIISRSLSPRDICNLSLCCRSLLDLATSDKVWLVQCDIIGVVPLHELVEWRQCVSSYRALCRFLTSVQPLFGIWVLQNPELGNVVYVMPGFVSVVACRIIPQELGPLGIEDGPILWAPVFEIISDFDGSTKFFLHGREHENDYFYPGSVKPVDRTCNVLLLEVEPRLHRHRDEDKLVYNKSFVLDPDRKLSGRVCNSESVLLRSQRVAGQGVSVVPFSRLSFGDRRKLLDFVTSQVRLKVPHSENWPLFPHLRNNEEIFQRDVELLSKRRVLLMEMYKASEGQIDCPSAPEKPIDYIPLQKNEIRKRFNNPSGFSDSVNCDEKRSQSSKRKTFGGYFRNGLKQILGKSISINGSRTGLRNGSSSSESRQAQFREFLRSGDTMGLTLRALSMKLSSYRAWPNMHDSRFALYKLPIRGPTVGQEYAGLWGGTFGWPPGRPTEDKPGKALFFLLLSYEESLGKKLLFATKILEGTHYVLHPNGSAMFIVNIDEPSLDPFPWNTDADSLPVYVKHAFLGDGIANGYGFRYPGSKPGSLYVIQDGLLAFIWKESRAVLTLQRLNLQELLKKGERVPALPPIANFSYLTKSYSNVFAGFSNGSSCLSSPSKSHV